MIVKYFISRIVYKELLKKDLKYVLLIIEESRELQLLQANYIMPIHIKI